MRKLAYFMICVNNARKNAIYIHVISTDIVEETAKFVLYTYWNIGVIEISGEFFDSLTALNINGVGKNETNYKVMPS